MALNPVTLAETLRPWHGAGVFYLLRESGPEDAFVSEQTAGDGSLAAQTGDITPETGARSFDSLPSRGHLPAAAKAASAEDPRPLAKPLPAPQGAPQSAPQSASQSASQSAPQSASQSASQSAPQGAPQSALQSVPGHGPEVGSFHNVPKAWKSLLDRTVPAPLLWTYAELGLDLTAPDPAKGSETRSRLLRSLIGDLQLPKGSSCFWPITLAPLRDASSEREGQATDAPVFEQGLDILSPKAVILFGARSCRLIGIQNALRQPFTQQLVRGRLFVLLPSFDELEAEPQLAARAAVYLRSAFAGFPALFIR